MDEAVAWEQVSERVSLLALFQDIGLVDITVHEEQLGYHLHDTKEWWELVWNSALRLWVDLVPAEKRDWFRSEHLAEVATLVTVDGLWLDVPVLFVKGRKPLHVKKLVFRDDVQPVRDALGSFASCRLEADTVRLHRWASIIRGGDK